MARYLQSGEITTGLAVLVECAGQPRPVRGRVEHIIWAPMGSGHRNVYQIRLESGATVLRSDGALMADETEEADCGE